MVFIKVKKNGYIHLPQPEFNDNNKFKIGLESMYLKSLNLINIESDCKIEIEHREIYIKKGIYSISYLNKLIEPVFLSYNNKKIQIESPCYYKLDEKFKKNLGFENTEFDFSLVGNTLMYCPTSEEKYINIDQECIIRLGRNGEIPKIEIPIGIYTINEIENLMNCYDFPKISLELIDDFLNITASIGLSFDEYLSNCLGFDYMGYLIPINRVWPDSWKLGPDIEYTITGSNKPIFYTQCFLKNINGVIFSQTKKSDKIYKTKIEGNYSIDQLNSILPSNIKLLNDNNFIKLTSKNTCLIDENLKLSLGIDNNFLYKHVGDSEKLDNNINKQLLEVHCNIIEKSVSSIDEKVIEEELLFVFYYDSNNLFIRCNPIMYRQVNVRTIQKIKIYILDQNGDIVNFGDDFIVYLDLIEEKQNKY